MPGIQVVLFDLGGTLIHYEQPPELTFDAINAQALRAFLAVAVRGGVRVPDQTLAIRAVGRMAAAIEAKSKRTHYASSADQIIREGLAAVQVTVPERLWGEALAAYDGVVSGVARAVAEDTAGVLARLTEQGRSLGMVSNTLWSPAMHDADLARFGLLEYLPVRVYSCAAHFLKPDARIFRQALDRLDVAPAEAVYVGDKLDADIAGPQKIGMRAVLLASPFRVEESAEIVPDARIKTLGELPVLLEKWDQALEPRLA
jgi:putative hydrolase of the HAD superfamily